MNADGTQQTNLTNTSTVAESYAAWSADGRQIAFIRSNDIWLMNTDGSNSRNFSSTPTCTEYELIWWRTKQTS
jgi:Tol biopolymer transport system component